MHIYIYTNIYIYIHIYIYTKYLCVILIWNLQPQNEGYVGHDSGYFGSLGRLEEMCRLPASVLSRLCHLPQVFGLVLGSCRSMLAGVLTAAGMSGCNSHLCRLVLGSSVWMPSINGLLVFLAVYGLCKVVKVACSAAKTLNDYRAQASQLPAFRRRRPWRVQRQPRQCSPPQRLRGWITLMNFCKYFCQAQCTCCFSRNSWDHTRITTRGPTTFLNMALPSLVLMLALMGQDNLSWRDLP